MKKFIITCSAFLNNGFIHRKYSCNGDSITPPLSIDRFPEETISLVLIMDDPDAPIGTFDHWIVWNIPPSKEIAENSVPGVEGMTSARRHNYIGPCPPSGIHRYFFKAYPLDTKLDLHINSGKKDVE